MITVCACESQPILIEGLRAVLDHNEDIRFLGAVADRREIISLVRKHAPTVCLIDSRFDEAGFELLKEMREHSPESKPVLWVDDMVGIESFRALQAGVRGILRKTLPAPVTVECLWAVGNGNIWIERSISHRLVGFISGPGNHFPSEREQEILRLIMQSKTNREIAAALDISVSTVKLHLLHMFEKAGVRSRLQLALQGLQWRGVLFPEGGDDPPPVPDSAARPADFVARLRCADQPCWAGGQRSSAMAAGSERRTFHASWESGSLLSVRHCAFGAGRKDYQ